MWPQYCWCGRFCNSVTVLNNSCCLQALQLQHSCRWSFGHHSLTVGPSVECPLFYSGRFFWGGGGVTYFSVYFIFVNKIELYSKVWLKRRCFCSGCCLVYVKSWKVTYTSFWMSVTNPNTTGYNMCLIHVHECQFKIFFATLTQRKIEKTLTEWHTWLFHE